MYGNGQAPIFILKEGVQRTRGRSAQSNNIAAAKAVADAVRSTLGPKGMDKMLVDSMGDVVITNDGATILKEMDIEHPAAKMIIEVAKTQEQHCYDGTTSAVVLSGELLKRSEDLIEQNVHPTVICEGFRLAAEKAVGCLESHGISTDNDDSVLMEVAKTSLTGKSAGAVKSLSTERSPGRRTVLVSVSLRCICAFAPLLSWAEHERPCTRGRSMSAASCIDQSGCPRSQRTARADHTTSVVFVL